MLINSRVNLSDISKSFPAELSSIMEDDYLRSRVEIEGCVILFIKNLQFWHSNFGVLHYLGNYLNAIDRQDKDVSELRRLEHMTLPDNLDYTKYVL